MLESDEEGVTTALDLMDMWRKEAGMFSPADRQTEADSQTNFRSTLTSLQSLLLAVPLRLYCTIHTRSPDRLLSAPLRLLTRLKLGSDVHWDLPWVIRCCSGLYYTLL